jgi:hypothetical protein
MDSTFRAQSVDGRMRMKRISDDGGSVRGGEEGFAGQEEHGGKKGRSTKAQDHDPEQDVS